MIKWMITIVTISLLSGAAYGKAPTYDANFEEIMSTYADIASGGAALAFFEHSKDFYHPNVHGCDVVTKAQVIEASMELFTMISAEDYGSTDTPTLLENTKKALNRHFSEGEYFQCEKGELVFMGYFSYLRFIKKDFSQRMQWVTGYED